jgi:Fur family transcriptional regulator, ferric uptake regulator
LRGQGYALSAREIYKVLRRGGSRIGLTTVYRTLALLVEAGTVHAFEREGYTVYRLCEDDRHRHLVCRICGLIVDAVGLDVDDMLDGVAGAREFHIEAIYGIGALCRGCE